MMKDVAISNLVTCSNCQGQNITEVIQDNVKLKVMEMYEEFTTSVKLD